ncbi:hypothetical protein BGX31_008650 [Mortierella sp. GBA43]|nr:hypothetical protein BGX31_008650 [Mortierella sp. GBA43]
MHRHRPWSFSKATWFIYLSFLAVRIFIATSSGYIHPDEFFQSAEISAGHVFNIQVETPWEYNPQLPCRSILLPAITTGLPFLLLKTWIGDSQEYVTTRQLFLTQRLVFVLISLIIDWAIVRMARQIKRSPSIALLLVSSSYVTLAYHTHPFSNSAETVILALCAVLLGRIICDHDASLNEAHSGKAVTGEKLATKVPSITTAQGGSLAPSTSIGVPKTTSSILSFALGILFAIGISTRITFVLYGFPLGVMFLYLNMKASFKKDSSLSRGSAQFIMACIPLALGIILMSTFAILIDSIYFGPQDWIHFHGSLTWTMLNNLRYNMDESNLAQHGLHPRYLHLLVNYPVLFVNLAWIGTIALFQKMKSGQWHSDSKLVTALVYSGISGVSFLSAMPHQEARFLTPLILPLVVSLSGKISRLGRKFWPLWLVVNVVMAIVFGVFHQSGLVPAIDLVQHQALGFRDWHSRDRNGISYSTRVIFYKTYMPPQHLFGYSSQFVETQRVNLTVMDWRAKSQDDLLKDLKSITTESGANVDQTLLKNLREQRGQQAVLFREIQPEVFERTILIAPATIDFSSQDFYETRDWISWHADFDRIEVILQKPLESLYLNVFYL